MAAPATMRRAELSEAAYLWDMAEGCEPGLAARLGLAGTRVGGAVVRVAANDPMGGFWNRCLGLGMTEPVTDEVLEEVIAFSAGHGAPTMTLQVAPEAEGARPELLQAHGLERGSTWVKFMGPLPDLPPVATDLRVDAVGPADVEEAATVVITGFEAPQGLMTEWCADQMRRPHWGAFAAWEGDRIVAAGMLFVHGDTAHLVGAATLPQARGRGAQSALMRARVEEARHRGCRWIGTETGAESPESPNPSLHNMRRLGFTELYERRNWVWKP
ncbi:MAG TPA: GNAT family N-acetyltransferase [Marmoricola sp.]|nr:GNAT family N-acetyltransferase [Marmoricola sp.]